MFFRNIISITFSLLLFLIIAIPVQTNAQACWTNAWTQPTCDPLVDPNNCLVSPPLFANADCEQGTGNIKISDQSDTSAKTEWVHLQPGIIQLGDVQDGWNLSDPNGAIEAYGPILVGNWTSMPLAARFEGGVAAFDLYANDELRVDDNAYFYGNIELKADGVLIPNGRDTVILNVENNGGGGDADTLLRLTADNGEIGNFLYIDGYSNNDVYVDYLGYFNADGDYQIRIDADNNSGNNFRINNGGNSTILTLSEAGNLNVENDISSTNGDVLAPNGNISSNIGDIYTTLGNIYGNFVESGTQNSCADGQILYRNGGEWVCRDEGTLVSSGQDLLSVLQEGSDASAFAGPTSIGGNVTVGGDVGIGTNNPSYRLQVDTGHAFIKGPDGFDASGEEAALYLGSAPEHYIKAVYGGGLRIGTYQAADALNIEQTSGNVGIGVLNSVAKFYVDNNSQAQYTAILEGGDVDATVLINTTDTTKNSNLWFTNSDDSGNDSWVIGRNNDGKFRIGVLNNGVMPDYNTEPDKMFSIDASGNLWIKGDFIRDIPQGANYTMQSGKNGTPAQYTASGTLILNYIDAKEVDTDRLLTDSIIHYENKTSGGNETFYGTLECDSCDFVAKDCQDNRTVWQKLNDFFSTHSAQAAEPKYSDCTGYDTPTCVAHGCNSTPVDENYKRETYKNCENIDSYSNYYYESRTCNGCSSVDTNVTKMEFYYDSGTGENTVEVYGDLKADENTPSNCEWQEVVTDGDYCLLGKIMIGYNPTSGPGSTPELYCCEL